MTANYIGRFAPSPTGPLHLGSLYTALASYLDAKANQGLWLVRIEDLDPPREQTGASQTILDTLYAHGLHWDGKVLYQSQRHTIYQQNIDTLLQKKHAFACDCSRKQLKHYQGFYSGLCHNKTKRTMMDKAIRLKTNQSQQTFTDHILGPQISPKVPDNLFNDFVIKRRDGLFAYQLAVVIDDIEQGISHIVRGSDILDSTFKQMYLYASLHTPLPAYYHLPVLNQSNGQKLSKQNLAPAINNLDAINNLLHCLTLLGQITPPVSQQNRVEDIIHWAKDHWDKSKITAKISISAYN